MQPFYTVSDSKSRERTSYRDTILCAVVLHCFMQWELREDLISWHDTITCAALFTLFQIVRVERGPHIVTPYRVQLFYIVSYQFTPWPESNVNSHPDWSQISIYTPTGVKYQFTPRLQSHISSHPDRSQISIITRPELNTNSHPDHSHTSVHTPTAVNYQLSPDQS